MWLIAATAGYRCLLPHDLVTVSVAIIQPETEGMWVGRLLNDVITRLSLALDAKSGTILLLLECYSCRCRFAL